MQDLIQQELDLTVTKEAAPDQPQRVRVDTLQQCLSCQVIFGLPMEQDGDRFFYIDSMPNRCALNSCPGESTRIDAIPDGNEPSPVWTASPNDHASAEVYYD